MRFWCTLNETFRMSSLNIQKRLQSKIIHLSISPEMNLCKCMKCYTGVAVVHYLHGQQIHRLTMHQSFYG